MINIEIILNKEDVKKIKLIGEDFYITKDIICKSDNKKYIIGMLYIEPKTLIDTNKEIKRGYFQISFTLGSHGENSPIRNSAILTYTLKHKEIPNVLLGQHILVNTINGERFLILVREE